MTPVAREDLTRETSASTNAVAESVCEDDCAELVSLAKPGAQKHLSKLSGGSRYSKKISPPPTEISLPTQGQENPGGPGIDGHTEVGCRLRGYEI